MNGGSKPSPAPVNQASTQPDLSSLFRTFSFKTLNLKTKQQELLIQVSILGLVYILAFILVSSVFFEKGFYEFWNWFDSESWYPLGRIIGGTHYPGIMVTAAIIYWALKLVRFALHIREVCLLTAPVFASNTTVVAYFFGKELWDSGAGLVAAALIAICRGYISRSVAGSLAGHLDTCIWSLLGVAMYLSFIYSPVCVGAVDYWKVSLLFLVASFISSNSDYVIVPIQSQFPCLISAIAVSATPKNLTQLVRMDSKPAHTVPSKGMITQRTCQRYDRAWGVEIGNKDVKLEYLEEAFTTSNHLPIDGSNP
ncbi:hypothetical protein L1887_17109 [Cichorium endivia]|nr:hypothetical protein L1887_17109 [Cichorium endivia]